MKEFRALVTGASSGIGSAFARALHGRGEKLVLVARRRDRLERLAADLGGETPAAVIARNLAAPGAAEQLAAEVEARGFAIDLLVNSAGMGHTSPFHEKPLDVVRAMIDLNVRVLTELTRRFTPDVIANKGGVLNVASTAAFQPGPGMAVYFASKSFVLSFTEALDYELKRQGANATALCPGPVETGFQERALLGPGGTARRKADNRTLTADQVADAGLRAFRGKRPVVIPGFSNAFLAWMVGVMPKQNVLRLVAQAYYKPKKPG